jgi:hypothetical protein
MLNQSLKKNLLVQKNEYILKFPIQIFSNIELNSLKKQENIINNKKFLKLNKPILQGSKKFKDKKLSLKFPLQIKLYNSIKEIENFSSDIKNIILKKNNFFFQKRKLLLLQNYCSKLLFLNFILIFRNIWLKLLIKL